MSTWLLPYGDLTQEQQRAVLFTPDRHRVVFGGPGSGKTMILLHRAAQLVRERHVAPGRFRIFVFTNVLKDYIRSGLEVLGLPEDCILTYDHWCNLYYTEHIGGRLPWNGRGPDYVAIRNEVFRHAQMNGAAAPAYDFILVDEGQDLDPVSFETMKLVSRHVTVSMDHKQQIFDNGASEDTIMRELGLNRRNMLVLSAYRCCPYIVQLASTLLPEGEERDSYLNQSHTDQTERQTPLLYYASDRHDELDRLAEAIRARQNGGDRIAVFLPTNQLVYSYASELKKRGIDLEVQRAREGAAFKPLDFSSDRPKVMTYHSAKGLTFDSVLLPHLGKDWFPRAKWPDIERLLFVGITRATKWVFLSSREDGAFKPLEKIVPLAAQGSLSIQRAGERSQGNRSSGSEQPEDENIIDIL